jgi:hypothetical protein
VDNLLKPRGHKVSPSSLLLLKQIYKIMIKQVINFIKAYSKGEEADLHLVFEFTWWEVAAILIIIGLIIWRVWW